jgi:Ca-activated chloride channel family protein
MLAADSLEPAVEALERSALSPEAAVRQRSLYNLGLAQLRRGLRSDAPDRRPLDEAIAAYRTLLLQRPADDDARWNYELALHVRKQQSGGGGKSEDKQNQSQQAQPRPPSDESKSMSRQQAEQLLASASRDEKESQAKRQRGARQEKPPGGKDW